MNLPDPDTVVSYVTLFVTVLGALVGRDKLRARAARANAVVDRAVSIVIGAAGQLAIIDQTVDISAPTARLISTVARTLGLTPGQLATVKRRVGAWAIERQAALTARQAIDAQGRMDAVNARAERILAGKEPSS